MQQTSSTNRRQIAALVSRMLSHFWTADDRVETREAQIEDWLVDLAEYGPDIVAEACVAWRRQPGGRRPTPGDIRALCIRERAELPPKRAAIEDQTDQDKWARALGWSSYLERQEAIARNKQSRAASLRWQADSAAELRAGRVRGFKSAAAALGATVKPRFDPSPEEMAASRRHLGIDPPLEAAE